ncbi:MAG: zinc carboxypeptidase [Bdellovibrionales bacterium]|nr:zinc carboxypeptidase [Bdellovibrionales bacterium]
MAAASGDPLQWLGVRADTREERTRAVDLGMSIEQVVDDMSYGFAPLSIVERMKRTGVAVESHFDAAVLGARAFPGEDSAYHDYQELMAEIDRLVNLKPDLVKAFSIGRSVEGRGIWALRLNPHAQTAQEPSGLPAIIFMGGHHAREHLSVETPLNLAKYLIENYGTDATVTDLLGRREVWIIPMVNPDGAEWDIASGDYKMWRKNRAANGSARCQGVDLNRNYGFKWGSGGSSKDSCSDVFMGPTAFSEPETQAVKKFVESRPNAKILLTFHTYSELILYPWGHSYDPIANARDKAVHETLARTMAQWNGYTPQQSSDLYQASGDTTDWSYGALGLVSFTFELSPRGGWGGDGFYPGPGAIRSTFEANLRPALYLIDLADDPYRGVAHPETTLFRRP